MICLTCQAPLVRQQTKFCSRSCYAIAQKGVDPFVNGTRSAAPWNKGRTLGPSPRNTQVQLSCLHCGSAFSVRRYRANVAKFCSVACAHQHRNQGLTVEHERQRKSAAYREWRTAVFERDDYTCQGCGQHGGHLHADHVQPFALFPDLRFEVSNGRTLCVPCHKRTDTYGRAAIYRSDCIAVARR